MRRIRRSTVAGFDAADEGGDHALPTCHPVPRHPTPPPGTARRRVQECKSTHRENGWRTNLGLLVVPRCFNAEQASETIQKCECCEPDPKPARAILNHAKWRARADDPERFGNQVTHQVQKETNLSTEHLEALKTRTRIH